MSVIIPVYNEALYIDKICEFLIKAKPAEKEIFFIDGGSKDETVSIISKWQELGLNAFVLTNKMKFVPFALNIAIPKCTAEIIVRLDAHNEYSYDYFEQILETFSETGADIVGGPVRTTAKTPFQEVVAESVKSKFGTGNSNLYNYEYKGYTDHVILGAWKKSIFSEVGYFDEEMLRDQDEEFHYRAIKHGKKIYISPDIKLYYHPRGSLKGLFKQYFQYGLFKPLALSKAGRGLKLRHVVPSLFTLYLISLVFFPYLLISIPFMLYLLADIVLTLRISSGKRLMMRSFLIFPAMHTAYGSGFILGIFMGRQATRLLQGKQGFVI
ncbi:MAG: glycosyltransferase family 2 protein [Ignavibacteriaceae bacterium]|nr:glycosyltransferase family 2 protein [Ignavibacteriaceae bacterium]